MSDHFLTDIEIKDFKCFKQFKIEGLQRVNLIAGKNNVGKTALMEACFVNVHAQDVNSFFSALVAIKEMRENINLSSTSYFLDVSVRKIFNSSLVEYLEMNNQFYTYSNQFQNHFFIDSGTGIKNYIFKIKNETIKVNSKDFSFEGKLISNINFIDNFGFSNQDIIKNFSAVQKKDAESVLNKAVQTFDPTIEVFKIIDEKPQCKVNGHYLEITEFGDGLRHIISIVTALYKTENGYLFIDEVDNGVFYQFLEEMWALILTLSKDLNVQVFATTHSEECIKAYYQAAKKLEEKNISYITMNRLKDKRIRAGVYDYELLENGMEQDLELRGW